jgi:hypothetical protein
MNCSDCHEALHQFLDGAPLPPRSELDAHLWECIECRELIAAGLLLRKGLGALPSPSAPLGLTARITSTILLDRTRSRRRRLIAVVSLAAAVLISIVGYSLLRPGTANHSSPPIARREAPVTQPPPPSLPQAVEEAGMAVVALTRDVAAETVGPGRSLFSVVRLNSDAGDHRPLPPALESPVQPLRAVGEGVSAGLEPVTTSARRAVDLFFRGIPAGQPKPRTGV